MPHHDPHLTFKEPKSGKGIPFAYIRDGTFKGEVLYISQDPLEEPSNRFLQDIPIPKELLKKYTPRECVAIQQRIQRALQKNAPVEDDISDIMEYLQNKNKEQTSLQLEGSDFMMCPSPTDKSPDRIFCFAMAGSGKSTWTANYCKQWRKIYKDKPIFMFCRSTEDPAFDGIDLIRIPMDASLLEQKICVESRSDDDSELEEGSFCIFDDICAGLDKDVEKEAYRILKDVLMMGRKRNIHCIHIEHRGADHNKTKDSLAESQSIVVFPWGCSQKALKYVLETYAGLGKKDIEKLRHLKNSRWALIRKVYPPAVLYEHGAYLLGQPDDPDDKSKK